MDDPPQATSNIRPTRDGDRAGTKLQRLFWFGLLWLGGVATVSAVAWLIRSVLVP